MTFNRFAQKELQRRGFGKSTRRTFWRFLTRDLELAEPFASKFRDLHKKLWRDYHRLTGDQTSHPE